MKPTLDDVKNLVREPAGSLKAYATIVAVLLAEVVADQSFTVRDVIRAFVIGAVAWLIPNKTT